MIDNVADPGSAEAIACADFERAYVIDRRKFHTPMLRDKNGKLQPYKPPRRTKITGVCLHQTACDMGERVERYDTISIHLVILRSGRMLWHCDFDRVLYGGNGWNERCIQIELVGLFAGVEDDPDSAQDESLRSTWDDPTTPTREQPQQVTEAQKRTLRMALRWLKLKVPTIAVVVSHRQASANRRNDPGETTWREAVAVSAELGLHDGGPGFVIGDGLPIPEAWDERYKGVKY